MWKQTSVKEKEKKDSVVKKPIEAAPVQEQIIRANIELTDSTSKSVSKKNAKMINLGEGLPMQISIEDLKLILTQPSKNAGKTIYIIYIFLLRILAYNPFFFNIKLKEPQSSMPGTNISVCLKKLREKLLVVHLVRFCGEHA